jgi:hypothetical protein
MTRMSDGWTILRVLALGAIVGAFWTLAAGPSKAADEEVVLRCPIEGQDRVASLSLAGDQVVYRYGRPQQDPELRLASPLVALDYRRADGAGDTIDERVTFANGDTRYELVAGFRDGAAADPSALNAFGALTVSRGGKRLARYACRSDGIERVPDRLLARMREMGRERTSDGVSFPNYPIHPATSAAQSAPCAADSNVDTCWSRGVSAARSGDLRGALEHYDMSCDARIGTMGCYEAGKLYLRNRQLRDYARARQRLARTCDGDDAGQGPYACKYLGWMSLTGTGVTRDLDEAFGALAQACFLHNDQILIDPEGCHFLGQAALERRGRSPRDDASADYLAYLAFAQGCTDAAETVCAEAGALYRRAAGNASAWITQCDREARQSGEITACADLARPAGDYDAAQAVRRQLGSMFRRVSTAMD